MFLLNGKKINIDMDLVINDITYPSKSLKNHEFRKSLGIIEVEDPIRKSDEFYLNTENEDGSICCVPKDLDQLKEIALQKVKEIRKFSLDTFVASPGISEVYCENIKAVQAIKAGKGNSIILRNSKTPIKHVHDFAKSMGVTNEEFLEYIENEVFEKGRKADEIENRYLKVAYSIIPNATFNEIQTVVSEFQNFCENVIKN